MTTMAVLGTGIMGAPMARNLAAAGHDVRAWNRTRDKAESLTDVGVTVTGTPAQAVDGAATVVTMLVDGDAVDAVLRDAADGLTSSTLWLQMSTVGHRWADELAALADQLGVIHVDAPVLGTRGPAEQGTLTVLAAGAPEVRDRAAEVFDVVGARTIWLDRPGQASRLKLVANAWVTALTAALAESVALAEHLDLDPERFLEAIEGGPVGAPYARVKGELMLAGDYPASFPAAHALKDVRLILDAADDGPDLRVARAVADGFAATVDAGHGDDDMSALRRVV
jgi:3-hydroxyisobutyrate dehydrogenase